uniref:ATP-dependent RNA helicase DDX5/DBP2 n=1 Tax=Tetraselmis sp. GSL018 TaxID=582737 RepID=A0A061S0N5_9CHLO|eukprot:CAMPEP_0177610812 /NCGR_PEP_ID=MMETSP0419_2-20121207/20036_1 /TAXON_ID=582737 /ORGANISM="Tetraselmis sp., Strain GSL018" /LENGTH=560 /DNA_ID=CAMNT_0019106257 /DNA_START=942 /DNA_END=2624 /DNA_ORIENTATION=-
MAYVPPHLRGGSASTTGPERTDSTGPRARQEPAERSRSSNWDSSRRTGHFQRGNSGPVKPLASESVNVENKWQPSDRVLKMTNKQIEEIRSRLNVAVEAGEGGDASSNAAPIESFHDMNLHRDIQADIRSHEYEAPTPIQAQAMPIALAGRDILGCAETGSGKTAAFAIPMIQHCLDVPRLKAGDGPTGLVLAPTRELAQQIDKEIRAFSRSSSPGLRTCIVVGGTSVSEQRSELRAGVDIVVATPGRFIDHLQQGNTNIGRVSYVVLDEADRMLDMGFEPQIRDVMRNLPKGHQTLLFSATMPVEIEKLAGDYLANPVRIKVGKVSTPTANVAQHMQKTSEKTKLEDVLTYLLEEQQAAASSNHRMPLTIVFVERKARCDEVADALKMAKLEAAALHGGLTQGEREGSLRDFTLGKIRVLVATDVASRGLDVKGIELVVNMDLPRNFEDYVHRIGRTGRAGVQGRATSFYTDRDSFLVAKIRTALSALEAGDAFAFETGKAARQKEKEMAQQFRQNVKQGASRTVDTGGGTKLMVDDKYKYMASTTVVSTGAADDAWDD